MKDNDLKLLVPFMEIKSILTGPRAVSLPFTDYCEPIIEEERPFPEVLQTLIGYGKKAGWKSLEIRGGAQHFADAAPASSFYSHILDLSKGEKSMFPQFRDSTRRNIQKAVKGGIRITFNDTSESIAEFYRLNCLTRKKHGLPPQPRFFFKKIYEHILAPGRGSVALADYNGATVAAALYVHFGKKAMYKYGASDSAYQHLRPNNLIMWEAIRRYSAEGYDSFCFGRTEPENKGLLQFKSGWGAQERMINYYKYSMKKNAFLREPAMTTGMHTRILRLLPVPCLRVAGSLLYRHIG
jgi:hypothetical protein